jgi:integral membrane sensor domain MASE1
MRASPSTPRTLVAVLVVFAGCFVGARIGSAIEFPGLQAAILFPPYAVLTAALLRAPTRRWWVFVLASSAGVAWPHLSAGSPLSFVLMAEVANGTRALVAAGGVRRFGGPASDVFESLRGMATFILFAVFLGPAAGALLGAGVVALHGGAYWLTFRAWLLSNVLTGLTLLPITLVRPRRMTMVPGRIVEAALLSLSLAVAGGIAFLSRDDFYDLAHVAIYVPLPLLLWAALRYGQLGTIASLHLVSWLAIAGALIGPGTQVGL